MRDTLLRILSGVYIIQINDIGIIYQKTDYFMSTFIQKQKYHRLTKPSFNVKLAIKNESGILICKIQ